MPRLFVAAVRRTSRLPLPTLQSRISAVAGPSQCAARPNMSATSSTTAAANSASSKSSSSTYLHRTTPSFTSGLLGRSAGASASGRPSIASAATSQVTSALLLGSASRTAAPSSSSMLMAASPIRQSVRCTTYGSEYQPNQLKRKRTHGFLARLRSRHGRKILKRRRAKGRRFLTH